MKGLRKMMKAAADARGTKEGSGLHQMFEQISGRLDVDV
jgi:hypothetical protein